MVSATLVGGTVLAQQALATDTGCAERQAANLHHQVAVLHATRVEYDAALQQGWRKAVPVAERWEQQAQRVDAAADAYRAARSAC